MVDTTDASRATQGSDVLCQATLESLRQRRLLPRSITPAFLLQTQLLGTEFCASLSASIVGGIEGTFTSCYRTPSVARVEACLAEEATAPTVSLLQDLSAHYGSHALRRAGGYPLGLCFSSRARRLSSGHHDGRRQLWSLSKAHKMWCRRCGLYFISGVTRVLLPPTLPRVQQFCEEGEVGMQSISGENRGTSGIGGVTGEVIKRRGKYVCCRCLRKLSLSRNTDKNVPGLPSDSTDTGEAECGRHGVVEVPARGSGVDDQLVVAQVGRTRRRKRARRGTVAAGPLKATQHLVPKGSLTRGKRDRNIAKVGSPVRDGKSTASIAKVAGGGNNVVPTRDAVGPVNSVENGRDVTCTNSETARKRETIEAAKPVTQFSGLPGPRKGRCPSMKKSRSSVTTSKSSFGDAMAKLGF
uniref:Uncharacterized protein n=1 Tax=Trypanosoma vivax (strain Y486) TaxID=1055687 RepID=G0U870_TRYVY|nr:conserved hypothetical protein [Trypanosoma vivax Y486]